MNKAVIILSAISLIFLIQFVSADVSVKNFSISTTYPQSATITGSINLSLSGISSNAYISSNVGQNISLINFLKQSAVNYSCNVPDCTSTYTTTGPGSPYENFGLSAGQSQVFGFLIGGNNPIISQGSTLSFNVTSDVGSSANAPQLSVDLLNKGAPEWNAYQPSTSIFGQEWFGCYNDLFRNYNPDILTSVPYCEKVSLPNISPEVNIGANVSGSGAAEFLMSIQDINRSSAPGTCKVDANGTGQISCIANISTGYYTIKKGGDFFVCINQTFGGSYQINTANLTNPCGFVVGKFNGSNYAIDFQIFGQQIPFASVGSFSFSDTEIANSGSTCKNCLEQEITSYLQNKYGDNCFPSSCVIPIGFNASQSQNINLSNLSLLITSNTGVANVNPNLYNVIQNPALINTGGYRFLSLNNSNFSVPNILGPYTFALTLVDGIKSYTILSEPINITLFPQVLSVCTTAQSCATNRNTLTVAAALPINFTANVNSDTKIVQYQWNFGDGSPIQTTTTNIISHTFNQTGPVTLQITISNAQGLSSITNFNINSIAPKDAVNQALNQDLQSFTNIQNQFGNFPVFTQNALNQSLNLGNISTELSNLQTKNSTASSDNDYINMMNVLLQINLPQSVQQSSNAASFPFIPLNNTINLDALVGAGGGTYDSTRQNDYLNSILSWDLNNISMTITYNEFSAVYGFSVVPILDVATLNLAESQPINNAYLFIKNSGKVYLDKTYPTTGSYYYVPLTGSAQTVQFATTQLFSPDQLPAFIAPSLSQISLPQQSASTSNNNNLILIVVIGTIAVIGVVSYILIGKWYQRRYESYLFKDRNDLYNIINYIHASKNKGLKGIEIEKNLRKSKWTAEQISYVMKRYAGKKVGILGFKKKK